MICKKYDYTGNPVCQDAAGVWGERCYPEIYDLTRRCSFGPGLRTKYGRMPLKNLAHSDSALAHFGGLLPRWPNPAKSATGFQIWIPIYKLGLDCRPVFPFLGKNLLQALSSCS
jgi:hypothetical protein